MKNKKITLSISIVIIILLCGLYLLKILPLNNKISNSNIKENNNLEISDLDSFYNSLVTKNYEDIRNLDNNYTVEQAIEDGCFVSTPSKIQNIDLYNKFMSNYKNNKNAFIRVVQTTTEGDIIIYDIMYDSNTKKIILVTDSTRDKFSSSENRIIKLNKYENTQEYSYNDNLYWVIYNNELNDDTFNSENIFIVTLINW